MQTRTLALSLLLLSSVWHGTVAAQTIGMSAERRAIDAFSVPAQQVDAPDVVVIGSLSGDAATGNEVLAAYEAYANSPNNFLDVTFIPFANPGGAELAFPPPEPAYSANWTAWSLWHWLASHAPDTVIFVGGDE